MTSECTCDEPRFKRTRRRFYERWVEPVVHYKAYRCNQCGKRILRSQKRAAFPVSIAANQKQGVA